MASILLGNVKGPQGDTGATGPQGEQGDAATIRVGSVTTTQYGQTARVTNSGTEHDAVFDFVIPQGRPGEQTTKIDNLTIDAITEPSTQFPVPAVGDNGSTLFGKITKWFSDMTALVATKFPTSNVVNNLTTTASGYALDARQGKALGDGLAKVRTLRSPTITVANMEIITLASGVAMGHYISDQYFEAYFSLAFTCSTNRAANLSVFKFSIDGHDLKFAVPHFFVCMVNSDGVLRYTYKNSDNELFLTNPVAWEAGKQYRVSGVALMEVV